MKLSENVKNLIRNYMTYLQSSTESEKDASKALEPITVVSRNDDVMFHVIGITSDPNTNGVILDLKSTEPFVNKPDGTEGSSPQYKYCTISGNEFDERFLLLSDWQHGLLNLTVAEMNREIFNFLHPYFITAEQDWDFELSCRGAIMRLKFWGCGSSYKHENLVIYVDNINKAHIELYGDSSTNGSIRIFEYDDTAVTMNPVPYGTLTEEDMVELCDKVESIMRRNLK